MKGLSKKQADVLSFVRSYIDTHHFAPSYREIQHHFGFSSVASVYKHLTVLKRKGAIDSEAGCSRSLFIETPAEQTGDEVQLPFFGYLSEEAGIETFPQIRSLSVPASLVHNKEGTYILRAKGESLKRELIAEDDLLLVETRQFAEEGELVILHKGEKQMHVKRLNEGDEGAIQGVITTLIRVL